VKSILVIAINLLAFRAGILADLAQGRVQFEATHAQEIHALALTPAELAVIAPRKL